MNTIVLGYDATPGADRALELAAELVRAFGASLVVTSVAPILAPAARGFGGVDPVDPPAKHRAQLKQAREKLAAKGIEAELVDGVGDPADAIVDLADERDADLIVVGTREPSFLERVLDPSVSAGVARKSHCDVLIVH